MSKMPKKETTKKETKKKTSRLSSMFSRSKSKGSTKKVNTKKNAKHKYTVIPSLAKNKRYTTRPEEFKSTLHLKHTFIYRKKTCVLSGGILKIYNRAKDLEEGKVAHAIDLGTSVISHQQKVRFSINAGDQIYRFKVKDLELFEQWINNLKNHRFYRQDQLFNVTQKKSSAVAKSHVVHEDRPVGADSIQDVPSADSSSNVTAESKTDDEDEVTSSEKTESSLSIKEANELRDAFAAKHTAEAPVAKATTTIRPSSHFRTSLPVTMVPCNVSIWSCLRIGKDMTKLSFPVEMFEPLGILQVMCEELEYSDLLDQASKHLDLHMRMLLISCFAISRYAASTHRGQRKPFSPLEGETYENKREDLGWNYVAEQVSHRPPISCCHAKSHSWEFWQSSLYTVAFLGKWIEAEQKTPVNLILSAHKEQYVWNKVVTSVHNLFSGPRYCDHHGKMTIKCSNGVSSKITFKKSSGSSKHEVQGAVHDSNNKVKHSFFGKWSEAIYVGDKENNKCVWKAKHISKYSPKFYGFNDFAMMLNELTPQLQKDLPPTDSRNRPDQRHFENGKVKEAQAKKTKLEENQRNRRKKREYKPKWFKKEDQNDYKFTEKYWEARNKDFTGIEFDDLWH